MIEEALGACTTILFSLIDRLAFVTIVMFLVFSVLSPFLELIIRQYSRQFDFQSFFNHILKFLHLKLQLHLCIMMDCFQLQCDIYLLS
jgi:hypothetical protein